MMVASMAVCAFADDDPGEYVYWVTEIYEQGYLLNDDNRVDFKESLEEEYNDTIPYGETVYYPLIHVCDSECDADAHHDDTTANSVTASGDKILVYESKATKNIKIKTDWEDGKSFIDEISVVRKRFENHEELETDGFTFLDDERCYFLAVTTKERSTTTTTTNDVDGMVMLKKQSGGDPYEFDYEDNVEVPVTFEVGYTNPDDSNTIPETPALFEPDEDFDESSDETFDFEADDNSYFVVNTNSQKKLVLGMDNEYDEDIAEQFPEADLYFFNGNGGRFNKIGYLYLYDDDLYRYAYSIDDNGELELVKTTHDDDCLVIRTRTLGRYVLSDVKLDIPDPYEEEEDKAVIFDNDTQTNRNPGTGGWGFDDIAYNGWGTPAPAAPAVVTAESKAEEPAAPAAESKTEEKAEPKAEKADKKKDEAKVEKTAAKAAIDAKATTVKVNGNVVEEGLNTRAMLLICCCVGAGASALGLLFCLFAAIAKSKNDY
ncbi:MAG: hypothetical protein J6C75_05420, partial [Oscillospiraceae bacterium]|nr:hypothetical protein [Oscillospiraceae bacterium]